MINLRKIEVYGFKSFADKLEMKFDYPITGIVGPNGCGKSNVCDAIRWVLGEQSTKTLRGKNMQDLIFAGTEKRKSMSYCEVSLFLDNKSRIFPIDMDEVIISRKLYRSNESEYYLNKNIVRLKDILDLLREAGLGREGYSIVGQGRMDAILNARPEDRRAIFEEALGISKFRARKIETERKLERTRDNMNQLYIIMNELERQLGPLKKQAADAEKYLKLQDELKYHEVNSYIYGYDTASDKKQALKTKIQALDAQLAQATAKHTEASDKYDKLYLEINNLDAMITNYRNQQLELSVQQERFSGETKLLNEKINNINLNNQDNVTLIDDEKNQMDRLKVAIDETIRTQQERKNEHQAVTQSLNQLNEKNLALADEINGFQHKVDQAQKQVIAVMNDMAEQRSHYTSLTTKSSTLSERITVLEQEIAKQSQALTQFVEAQSQEILNLIEGDYVSDTCKQLANNLNGFVTQVESLIEKVDLTDSVKNKLDDKLRVISNVSALLTVSDGQNVQQNLILLSALKERLSKYSALYLSQKNSIVRLQEEREADINIKRNFEEQAATVQATLDILTQKKDNATNYVSKYQDEYSLIKLDKDKIVEEISSTRVKLAGLSSNIVSGDGLINTNRQTIARLSNDINSRIKQVENNRSLIEELYRQVAEATNNKVDMELLDEINRKLADAGALKSDIQTQYSEADHVRQKYNALIAQLSEQRSKEEYVLLKIDDDITALQEKILNDYGYTYSSALQFKDEKYNLTESKDEINRLRSSLGRLGYVNPNAVKEYEETNTRYVDLTNQMNDMKKAESDLNDILSDLTKEIVIRFNDGFEIINNNFAQVFKELFAGGHAHMSLDVDENQSELDYGIEIEAQPPGKKLQNISLLSGGERTLTAAAILFAILKLRPMPFCVLDEIEAALDDANAERIASYIRKYSSDTQFLVITHKKPTMEACDVLYGVTMEEKGVSKIVSVQLTDAVSTAV